MEMADLASELVNSARITLLLKLLEICQKVYQPLESSELVQPGTTPGDQALVEHFVEPHADGQEQILLIAFAGTSGIDQWISNADTMTMELWPFCTSRSKVHAGFLKAFKDFEDFVKDSLQASDAARVIFTGHSRGGAIATLAACYAKALQGKRRIELVTFGAPKPGDKNFRNQECKNLRIARFVNSFDPVPGLPPLSAFEHPTTTPDVVDCKPVAVADVARSALQQWEDRHCRLSPHDIGIYERNFRNLRRNRSLVMAESVIHAVGPHLKKIAAKLAAVNPVLGTAVGIAGWLARVYDNEPSESDMIQEQIKSLQHRMQEGFHKTQKAVERIQETLDGASEKELRGQVLWVFYKLKQASLDEGKPLGSFDSNRELEQAELKLQQSLFNLWRETNVMPRHTDLMLSAILGSFQVKFASNRSFDDMRQQIRELNEVLPLVPKALVAEQASQTCPYRALPTLRPCIESALTAQSGLVGMGRGEEPKFHETFQECFSNLPSELLERLDPLLEVERLVRTRTRVRESAKGLWERECGSDRLNKERFEQFLKAIEEVFEGPGFDPDQDQEVRSILKKSFPSFDNARELHLAVVGSTKSGKSTLINAILGDLVLPASEVAETALPVVIKFEGDAGEDIQVEIKGEGLREQLQQLMKRKDSRLGKWLAREAAQEDIMKFTLSSRHKFGEWLDCLNQDLRGFLTREVADLECADWYVETTFPGEYRAFALVDCPGGTESARIQRRLQQMIQFQVERAQVALLAVPCESGSFVMGGSLDATHLGGAKPNFTTVLVCTKAAKLRRKGHNLQDRKAFLAQEDKRKELKDMGVRPEVPVFFVSALTLLAFKLSEKEPYTGEDSPFSEELQDIDDDSPNKRQDILWRAAGYPDDQDFLNEWPELLKRGVIHQKLQSRAEDGRHENNKFEAWLKNTVGTMQGILAINCLLRSRKELQEALKRYEEQQDSLEEESRLEEMESNLSKLKSRHNAVAKALEQPEPHVKVLSDSLRQQVTAVCDFLGDRDAILDQSRALEVLDNESLHDAWRRNHPDYPKATGTYSHAGLAALSSFVVSWLRDLIEKELEVHQWPNSDEQTLVKKTMQKSASPSRIQHSVTPGLLVAFAGCAFAGVAVLTGGVGLVAGMGISVVADGIVAPLVLSVAAATGGGICHYAASQPAAPSTEPQLLKGCFCRQSLNDHFHHAILSGIKRLEEELRDESNKVQLEHDNLKEKVKKWRRKKNRLEQADKMLEIVVTDLILLQEELR